MKQISILLTLSFLLVSHNSYAHPYKIKEYEDSGPIRISFKLATKSTGKKQKYELCSIRQEDIGNLKDIRRKPEVYTHYADHSCPSEEAVEKQLTQTLLPRTERNDSLFPFVLKKVIKVKGEMPSEPPETLGLFNVGTGFKENDRMFGFYTNPGRQLEEGHYENWGNGLGSVAVKILTHFVMQFHENAPGALTIQTKKNEVPQNITTKKTRFSGVLSATSDSDNSRSVNPLVKAGLRKLSTEEIEEKGVSEEVKTMIQVGEEKIQTIKNYYELTWEEFKENEEKGLYH
jgi:hypothetical protein